MSEFINDLKMVMKFLKYLKISKYKLIVIIFVMVISNVTNIIQPLLIGNLIDFINRKEFHEIYVTFIYLIVSFIISQVTKFFTDKLLIKYTSILEIDIKKEMFNAILKKDLIAFNKISVGKLLNSLEEDSRVFSNLLNSNIHVFISIVSLLTITILMLTISPVLTIVHFFMLPIVTISTGVFGKLIKKKIIVLKSTHDLYSIFLNESFYGFKNLKIFNSTEGRVNDFENRNKKIYDIGIDKVLLESKSQITISTITFISQIIMLIMGVFLILNRSLTIGKLVSFNSYSTNFRNTSSSLSNISSLVQDMSVSLNRIQDILENVDINLNQKRTSKSLIGKINNISCENLKFKYNDINAIADISFKISGNGIYVINGKSGSGKTTLLNILSSMYNDYSGNLKLNSIELKDINPESLLNKISFGVQDYYVYSLSIYENIMMYRNFSYEDVEQTCKRLDIHEVIKSMPKGYDTILNSEGISLSGGQIQRICIARAILSKSDVYLFDEITSNLDTNTIIQVVKVIESLSEDSIVIISTHADLPFKKEINYLDIFSKSIKNNSCNLSL